MPLRGWFAFKPVKDTHTAFAVVPANPPVGSLVLVNEVEVVPPANRYSVVALFAVTAPCRTAPEAHIPVAATVITACAVARVQVPTTNALLPWPWATAMASIVSAEETGLPPVYFLNEVAGSVLSVV